MSPRLTAGGKQYVSVGWRGELLELLHSLKIFAAPPQNILEDEVDRYDHKIWGFKIYRLTYDDDWKWQAFMEELVRQTRTNLERELKGSDLERLTSMLDWAAENDKTKWDGATLSQVRKYVHAYYWYCCFHSRGFWN